MSNVSAWSTTASSNNSAAPNGAPEGMAPSGVNDTMREMMAAVARWYQDTDGGLVTGGTATAYTLTTSSTFTSLADISLLVFRVHTANTGAATLAVDGLTAKNLFIRGAAMAANDLLANTLVAVSYNANQDRFDVHHSLPNNNASNLTAGSLPDARLSAQVVLKDTAISSVDNGDSADPGYRGAPITSATTPYTLVLGDCGRTVKATGTATTITIPDDAAVDFPDQTIIRIHNRTGGNITVTKTTAAGLLLNGSSSTGARTLPNNSVCEIYKSQDNEWIISGPVT